MLGRNVAKYGAQAIYGRTMSAKEVRMINTAETVYYAYLDRQKSQNWPEWAKEHPFENRLLELGLRLNE